MKDEDVRVGDHIWAMMDEQLLVALKQDEEVYYLCGEWGRPVGSKYLTIVSIIDRPEGLENNLIYFR